MPIVSEIPMDISQKRFRVTHTLSGFIAHAVYQSTNADKKRTFQQPAKNILLQSFLPKTDLMSKMWFFFLRKNKALFSESFPFQNVKTRSSRNIWDVSIWWLNKKNKYFFLLKKHENKWVNLFFLSNALILTKQNTQNQNKI